MTIPKPETCSDCGRPKTTAIHERGPLTCHRGLAYVPDVDCYRIAFDRARPVVESALGLRHARHAEAAAFDRLLGVVGEERVELRMAWDVASVAHVDAARAFESALDVFDGKAAP